MSEGAHPSPTSDRRSILQYLRDEFSGVLARNTGWMFGARILRFALAGVYFVLLTRSLGAAEFGLFSGALAFVHILSPLSGWGTGDLLVEKVSQDSQRFREYWGKALTASIFTGSILTAVAGATANLLFAGVGDVQFVILLGLAVLIFKRVAAQAGQVFQAREELVFTAVINVFGAGSRLLAVAMFVLIVSETSASVWAWWLVGANLVTGLVAVALVTIRLGLPVFRLDGLLDDAQQGFYYALGLASRSVYSDVDKAMLLRLRTETAAGIYTAGYRLVSFGFAPVQGLLSAAYARFFHHGSRGVTPAVRQAMRIGSASVAYSLLLAVGLFWGAPLIPLILGPEYSSSIEVVRLLAFLPVIQSLHFVAGDALTGLNRQRSRATFQLLAAAANVVLNLLLIPNYGWRGAAVATLVTEGTLAIILCGTLASLWLPAREERSEIET